MSKPIQLKITLQGSDPEIWRRIIVEDGITMFQLHHVIQICMGWENRHLFLFNIHKHQIGWLNEEWDEIGDERNIVDANGVTLESLALDAGDDFIYIYDLGDDWFHRIEVETVPAKMGAKKVPVCVDGSGACPPEDVGGMIGFADWAARMKDNKVKMSKEDRNWFKAVPFKIEAVNGRLTDLQGYIEDWDGE
jgi:hypothetical protein